MAFRRRKSKDENETAEHEAGEREVGTEELEAQLEDEPEVDSESEFEPLGLADADSAVDDAPAWPSAEIGAREGGPWDFDELPAEDKVERVDLGGVQIPIVAGMELRAEIAEDQVVAATLVLGRSALQLQPFAAPRTIGIWHEVRAEIAAGIAESGGRATESEGRFGAELVAQVGVTMPDGTTGTQTARFLGVNGPRWFLRAVITGEAAEDPGARTVLEDLLADVVVVRGADAMAPRDAIALRLPEEVDVAEPGSRFDADDSDNDTGDGGDTDRPRHQDDLKPFERGPEITEIR